MLTSSGFSKFDPTDPLFRKNPYPFYHAWRKQSPILYREETDDWLITGYDEVKIWLEKGRRSQGKRLSEQHMKTWCEYKAETDDINQLKKYAKSYFYSYAFNRLALPEHSEIKKNFASFYDKAAVKVLEGFIQDETEKLLNQFSNKQNIDLIKDFVLPLTIKTSFHILGISQALIDRFSQNVNALYATEDLPFLKRYQLNADMAFLDLAEYFDQRLTNPTQFGDGFIDYLASEFQLGRIDYPFAMGNAMQMIYGSFRNAQDALGMAFYYLLQDNEQKNLLINNPDLMDNAIEELLRIDSHLQCYYLKADSLDIGLNSIRDDQFVYVFLGAANRDPLYFEHPDRLNFQRSRKPHVSFSGGHFFCLGHQLARLEMRVAISNLLDRYPKISLNPQRVSWHETYVIRGLKQLGCKC